MTRGTRDRLSQSDASHRRARVGKLIIRALAEVFNEQNFQLETMMITLSEVKMSADLRVAHIYFRYITIGSAREVTLEEATLFLQNQAGLIRRRLASRVYLKFLPELRFHHDDRLGKAEVS